MFLTPGVSLSGGRGGLIKAPWSRVWAKRQRGFRRVREGGSPPDLGHFMSSMIFKIFNVPPASGGELPGGGSYRYLLDIPVRTDTVLVSVGVLGVENNPYFGYAS